LNVEGQRWNVCVDGRCAFCVIPWRSQERKLEEAEGEGEVFFQCSAFLSKARRKDCEYVGFGEAPLAYGEIE